jgi:CubicO group peptidase (beta-lactamase class C family)
MLMAEIGYGHKDILRNTKELILEQMEKEDIPGLSIALVDGQELVWAEGFGFTDRSKKNPVTVNTPFSIQSAGKMYTATGFLIAASRRLVHLDDPLRKHYPQFRVNSRFGSEELDKITFRSLLAHHAGLCHEAPVGNNYDDRTCTFNEHIASIADTWLKSLVGERLSYSNLGMDLTAYALQLLSGKSFAQYMEDEILRPLGMIHSTYNQHSLFSGGLYAKGHRGLYETPNHYVPMLGAGGLFVSARDAAKFVSFHLSGCVINGRQLIDQSLLDEMYTIQYPVGGQVCGFGLGTIIEPRFGTTLIFHPGGGMGYQTIQAWHPTYGLGVVVLLNQAGMSEAVHIQLAHETLRGMIQAKYGSVPDDRPLPGANRPTIHLAVDSLHRFEGKYRGTDNITANTLYVQEKNGALYLGETQRLRPFEPAGFTTKDGARVTFHLDDHGQVDEMCILGRWGYSRYPLDHAFRQNIGPDKAAWKRFTGIYTIREDGLFFFAAVSIKNGYLAINGWMGDALLDEYQPGLFFTADGEAVIFRKDTFIYGNAIHVRENDPCQIAIAQADSGQLNQRLTKGALTRLRKAYQVIGEQEKANMLRALDARLHPST